MKIRLVCEGAMLVEDRGDTYLFGGPEGIGSRLKECNVGEPKVFFQTHHSAPGFTELGQTLRFKEQPYRHNGFGVATIDQIHGTDFVVETGDGRVLFSERGDVSVRDVVGYDLAITRNKHRPDAFGERVITWPWPDIELELKDGKLLSETFAETAKPWSSMSDVPANIKKIDGTPLTLAQANFVARVAQGSGENGKENWAIAISQFKKSYKKVGDGWVEKEKEGDPVKKFGDVLTAALHKAYNDTSDYYFSEGFLNQDERLAVASSIGPGLSKIRELLPNEVLNRTVKSDDDLDGWFGVWKEDDEWCWAAISSVTMVDLEQEVFTPKAMQWAIKASEIIGKGPIRYRHIPGLDGGECTHQAAVGGFLFERGSFANTPLGQAMRQKAQEQPMGISLGLWFAPKDLLGGMFFKRALVKERSMTPKPMVPATTMLSIEKGDNEMLKPLSEEQLKSIAEELELDVGIVEALHKQALASGSQFGPKEFKEAVKAAKVDGGADAKSRKAAKKMDASEEEMAADEEEMVDGEKSTEDELSEIFAEMSKDELAAVENLLLQAKGKQQRPLTQQRAQEALNPEIHALLQVVKEQSAVVNQLLKATQQGGLNLDLAQARKSAQPLTQASAGGSQTDDQVQRALAEAAERSKSQTLRKSPLWDAFTSKTLNQPRP